ncbi:MAG: GNAT family N-acetyltransferase, partial [Muribaculaceae bacterium]|nr:GNAT family N-acetyltransferase [Muribaculaceae bacterium]
KIPHRKRHRSYPAMLIGRLGVNQVYRGKGLNIGTQVMDLVKILCVNDEGMGICRYLLVDAYNTDATLHFYLKNGFKLLYKTEESEREMFEISYEESLRSRIMYFDLKLIKT